MKLLFVTTRFPFPPIKGDKIRAYYPIKYLSKDYSIDLISFSDEEVSSEYYKEMEQYCDNITIIKQNKLLFLLKLFLAIFSGIPSQVFCYSSKKLSNMLDEIDEKNQYDIVNFVNGRLAGYAGHLLNTRTVVDWIDALSLSTKRMHETEAFFAKKILYRWEWKKMVNFEKEQLKHCDHSIITSEADKKHMNSSCIEVLPNGVDASLFTKRKIKQDIDLIFTGNMSYYPNVNAVNYFCRKIFPLVKQKRPDTNFYIVGINPSSSVLALKNEKGVYVTGFVEDIVEMLNRSRVFIAPLCSGAGIQNKILEGMACALPVITTSFGNAGIQGRDNTDLLERNSPEEFAEAVLQLLEDEERRELLGKQGESLVKSRFSWENMAVCLSSIYVNLDKNL